MESIRPNHIESLNSLIYKDINDEFGKARYLDHEVIIMKQNGYINMTKLCDIYGKQFKHWKENKQSKELIEIISQVVGIPTSEILIIIDKEYNQIRGTYVHPKLAPHIAGWISPKVAVIISDIVNNYQVQQYQRSIAQKDDKIDELSRKIDQLLLGNEQLSSQNEEIKESLDQVSNKLDYATEEYVPVTQDRSKEKYFVLMKNQNNSQEFYTIRRQKQSLQIQISLQQRAGYYEIMRFKNPNTVNILNRLKELDNRNIKIVGNNIKTQPSITEEILKQKITEIEQEKKHLNK